VAGVWIEKKRTTAGEGRYRVAFRIGGRESKKRNGGSFRRKQDAYNRAAWIRVELGFGRIPDLTFCVADALTFAEAACRWQESRIDVREATRIQHRSAINRVLPLLGGTYVDRITPADVAAMVTSLHAAGAARETIRKSRTAVAMTLDYGDQTEPGS
jgi:hypothetical protein